MSELVQIGDFRENGYQTVVKFGGWRAAYLNNTSEKPSDITYLERHVESDELFVLVEGSCKLILSSTGFTEPEIVEMEPLVMYNVRQTAYHAVQMQPGCRILIVENHDVSKENTLYYYLTEEEKTALTDMLSK